MKQDSIQQMLERYREGTLGAGEIEELNRLTHRDEVMEAAVRRADGIVRRRRAVVLTVAGLLVAGAAVWSLLPLGGGAEPALVAEAAVPEMKAATPAADSAVRPLSAPVPAAPATARKATPVAQADPSPVPCMEETIQAVADEVPVVVCNNQCEADSVISDIWKFLNV